MRKNIKLKFLYRYTSNGEGVWSVGKRLLPSNLVEEANEARKWLVKPNLPEANYIFYMTYKGKKMYEKTLLRIHKKYLSNIKCERLSFKKVNKTGNIVYEDDYQIVLKK